MKHRIAILMCLLSVSCVTIGSGGDPPARPSGTNHTAEPFDCAASCEAYGFACDAAKGACGDPLDPVCFDDTVTYCDCVTCTDDVLLGVYTDCYNNKAPMADIVTCFGTFGSDCHSAISSCAPQ